MCNAIQTHGQSIASRFQIIININTPNLKASKIEPNLVGASSWNFEHVLILQDLYTFIKIYSQSYTTQAKQGRLKSSSKNP